MKNVLFASTALVAFAGAAQAEVLLTGNAELGMQYGDGGVADTSDSVEFFTDLDVTFTMSGETDGGLTFGATIDLDEGGDGAPFENDRTQGGETIFISGGFGTLTAGDTDGALDWAMTEVAFNSGSLNDDETEHAGYLGSYLDGASGGQIIRYDYSFGDFGIAVSAEDKNSDGDENSDFGFGIGVRYLVDLGGTEVSLGAGYQKSADEVSRFGFDIGQAEALGFSASATFADSITAGIQYTDFNVDDFDGDDSDDRDGNHVGVGVGYSAGAISLSANYGEYNFDGDEADSKGYGLTAGYDLGGGAAIQLGYGRSDLEGSDDDFDTMSFGVRMNF